MDLFTILILVCAFSFAGILCILGRYFYLSKDLKKEEICEGVVSSKPFFNDFEERLEPWMFSLLNKLSSFICSRKELKFLKQRFCHLSDYMNGRHKVEQNGCKGYWDEVNGYKKDCNEEE